MENNDIAAELAASNETLGKRIREAELQKIPYILIVGDKEFQNQTVNIRHRGEGLSAEAKAKTEEIKIDGLIEKIKKKLKIKSPEVYLENRWFSNFPIIFLRQDRRKIRYAYFKYLLFSHLLAYTSK